MGYGGDRHPTPLPLWKLFSLRFSQLVVCNKSVKFPNEQYVYPLWKRTTFGIPRYLFLSINSLQDCLVHFRLFIYLALHVLVISRPQRHLVALKRKVRHCHLYAPPSVPCDYWYKSWLTLIGFFHLPYCKNFTFFLLNLEVVFWLL